MEPTLFDSSMGSHHVGKGGHYGTQRSIFDYEPTPEFVGQTIPARATLLLPNGKPAPFAARYGEIRTNEAVTPYACWNRIWTNDEPDRYDCCGETAHDIEMKLSIELVCYHWRLEYEHKGKWKRHNMAQLHRDHPTFWKNASL